MTFSSAKKDVGRLWGLPQTPRDTGAFEIRGATNTSLKTFIYKQNKLGDAIAISKSETINHSLTDPLTDRGRY